MMVRVPEDLRDRIKASADAFGRSQNSEIVATLLEHYPAPSEEDLQNARACLMKLGVQERRALLKELEARTD